STGAQPLRNCVASRAEAWDRQLFQSLGFWQHWLKNNNLIYAFGKDSINRYRGDGPKTGVSETC
ncbi:hypothetical protein, partial [Mesorhizobium sp.]|uniref:hypothetical protein n=1 Tax=Mesorhizobium sp. TaxID=1871066 RepID=UPI0025B9F03F